MRLHTALEYFRGGKFRSREPWPADEPLGHRNRPDPARLLLGLLVPKTLDETVHLAAFCELDGKVIALSTRVMFETKNRSSLVFVNQSGHKIIGDHKRVLISHADTDTGSLLTDNGFGVVAALLGALSTPQAIRHEEPAPVRLNKQREQKGKVPIAPMIVIDVRASHVAKSQPRGSTGWTVIPHWRRSHLRTLADGRVIPVASLLGERRRRHPAA